MKTQNYIPLLAVVFILAASAARGQGTIISISGPPDTNNQWGAALVVGGYPEGVSWIATSAFSNVNISVALGGDSGATGMAYLTTSIGPGTTTADEIISASFAFPSTLSLAPVLSGLNLESGTYYLILEETATGSNGNGYWNGTPSPSIISAANVTANGEYWYFNSIQGYPPATQFSEGHVTHYEYTVTGDPVPEPSVGCLILLGGGVLLYVRKRIKR